jgi:hypothetical protein
VRPVGPFRVNNGEAKLPALTAGVRGSGRAFVRHLSKRFGSRHPDPPEKPTNTTLLIRLSGEVVKRKKKLSKKYYGTSHVLSKDEAKFVYERGSNQLIVGSGQMGNVRLSPEAEAKEGL